MVKVKINGKTIKVEKKSTIIEVADSNDIEIPRFCYHKKLSIAANCRMCLVEVKNFPKPLPACATYVSEGMEIFTKSKQTKACQQDVMEFLLINHPLDCPICDQGGECDLQDTAMSFGSPKSRYTEEKRVVLNKNLGPLVSTDLNRCIQCSRCVRFLQEVGGMQELGLIGRGEHAEISAYVEKSVESEISGNIIDLCPVGALTSKPFRYSARTWEMARKSTISPHDSLGSNIEAHVKDGNVMRILPKENEDINECWISDRDRFSYLGVNHDSRIKKPLVKQGNVLKEIDWEDALQIIESKLHPIRNNFKEDDIAFFGSDQLTLEEGFLLKKISEHFSSNQVNYNPKINVNYVSNPHLNIKINEIESFDSVILIGSNLRDENPLILQRLRKMTLNNKKIDLIHYEDQDLQLQLDHKLIKPIEKIEKSILEILEIALDHKKAKKNQTTESGLAEKLKTQNVLILIGQDFVSRESILGYGEMLNQLVKKSSTSIGFLPTGANSVGLNQIFNDKNDVDNKSYKASITFNHEPEHDSIDEDLHKEIIKKSSFNILISAYQTKQDKSYDLILPSCSHFENEGSFVNLENKLQTFTQVIPPKHESKPLWKILRVLGNYVECDNFNYESCTAVKKDAVKGLLSNKNNNLELINKQSKNNNKIFKFSINNSDPMVRRSKALQDIEHLRSTR